MNFNRLLFAPFLLFLLLLAVSLSSCTKIVPQHHHPKPNHEIKPSKVNSTETSTADVSCRQNATICGENAFCSPTTKLCQCNLGYYKPNQNSSCTAQTCPSSNFCRWRIGLDTKCALDSHRCVCDDSFELDLATQTCRPVRQPRGAFCAFDLQCGAGAVCGTPLNSQNSQNSPKSCICKLGYLPADSNPINCEPYSCTTDYDCSSTFSATSQTVCQSGSCQCNSAAGWTLNAGNQSCVSTRAPLNGSCLFDSDCGQGAMCGGGNRCRCKLGYQSESSNNINCLKYSCSSDLDCSLTFRGIAHLTCQYGSICQCDAANGWNLLTANQSCTARSVLVGGDCIFDSDCGLNSDCVAGQCKCLFGDALDPNAVCSWNSCICREGYSQNFISQSCVSDGSDLGGVLAVVGLIMLGVFVVVCGAIVVVWAVGGGRNSRPRAAYIQKS
ncbi:hypothetical protein TYRP_019806 [Tyrophagus putrescentiae]|nr:hypothetical protein TYRP_019806 [Tyrophagus putrescentiae]